MQITPTIDELLDILIEISDSDDFVRAVVGAAGNDENRQRIIDYIRRVCYKNKLKTDNKLLWAMTEVKDRIKGI